MRRRTTRTTLLPSAAIPCAAASRARVSRHTSCCSRLWPARRLGGCAGFLWSGCGRTMQSTSWTSVRPASASPERRCSPSCCRPRCLCAVSSTPSTLTLTLTLTRNPNPLSAPIDTPLPSHRPNLAHASQSLWQRHRRRGRLRARCRPQGDEITTLKCAAAPIVFAFVSAPLDTPHSHSHPAPMLAVCADNSLGPERGRSPALGQLAQGDADHRLKCAAAPECSLFCQRPLTRLLSHCFPLPLARSLT